MLEEKIKKQRIDSQSLILIHELVEFNLQQELVNNKDIAPNI